MTTPTRLAALASLSLCLAGLAGAAVVRREPSRFDRLVIHDPSSMLGLMAERPGALPGFEAGAAAWEAWSATHGGGWRVHLDRRSGSPLLVEGTGIPWFNAGEPLDAAALEAKARELVSRHEALFRIRESELALNREGTGATDPDHWVVIFDRVFGGVPVEGERLALYVTRGRLTALGADRWGAIERLPESRYGAEAARAALGAYMGIGPGERVAEMEPGRQVLLAAPPDGAEDRSFRGAVGEGVRHLLAWRFVLRVEGEPGTWVGKVDATTGEVIALFDDTRYAQVKGGVFPISNDGNCGDFGCELASFPMPYANVTIGGTLTAGDMGIYDCSPIGDPVSTSLTGPYVQISDNCGAVSESDLCDDDLDLRASGGTDCAVPAGDSAGNTHSSRTNFYHLNRIKEKGRYWLPSNTWLTQQLTANLNISSTCNAFWDGSVNFYRSGGGCRNTGEIGGVIHHEWGHGMDQNDGGGYDNPSEAYADVVAIIQEHRSCVGRGFFESSNCGGYGDACLNCTGIRDMDWDQHQSHTPHTPANFTGPNCGGGGGPCGREVHCESYVPSEAIFDLAFRDLPASGMDLASAWQLTEKLFYKSRQGSGGNALNCSLPNSDGCGASNWFPKFRNADDDDGNLNNGTPHAAAIFAAFDRHKIACGAASDASNQSTSSCSSLSTPLIGVSASTSAVTISWASVPGAARYLILRNEVGCDYTSNVIAEVATPATSYVDDELPNDFTVYYRVQAQGSNTACESPVSECESSAPQPLAGTIKLNRTAYGCDMTIQITVRDANIGAPTTTATIWSNSEPTPETVTLTETPPGSSKYFGSIQGTSGPSSNGDGMLALADGDLITAQYVDADDGQGGQNVVKQTTAIADCRGPIISGVGSAGVSDTQTTIAWNTDESSDSTVHWGQLPPPSNTTSSPTLVANHNVTLTGLQECTVYWYSVESKDGVGNAALDDNGGQYFHFETLGDLGNGLQPCHQGSVSLGQTTYSCSQTVQIKVVDLDLNLQPTTVETMTVTVSSTTESAPETVTLTETGLNTSQFTGSIVTSSGPVVNGDGVLQAQDDDLLTATYQDADDGTGLSAVSFETAVADCAGPGGSSVQVTDVTDESAIVRWTTSEPATSRVEWGLTPALGNVVTDGALVTSHALTVGPLAECGRFYFRVSSTDVYGNTGVYDASGAPFEFNAWRIPGLFVDNFEASTGWTLEGEWQIGSPLGLGSSPPDPSTAYAGTKVLGHDLTGLGAHLGDYEPQTTQSATSPVINASALTQGQLKFRRWLNVGNGGISFIEVKNGGTWFTVWSSNSLNGNTETSWSLQTLSIAQHADGNAQLQIRFRQYGGLNISANRSGWNVDRFVVKSATQPDFTVCGGCAGAPSFAGAVSATDVGACADTGVQVDWQPAVSWGTGSTGTYSVFRDTTPGFTPSASNRIAAGVAGTSYTDGTAPNGVALYYIVRAENDETCSTGANNGGLVDGNLVRVSAQDETSQPSPGDVGGSLRAAPINDAHVRLTWDSTGTAAAYRLYRAQSPQGPFTQIVETTALQHDDGDAMGDSASFYYRVKAVDACGNEGP